jgi:hypothetical protein
VEKQSSVRQTSQNEGRLARPTGEDRFQTIGNQERRQGEPSAGSQVYWARFHDLGMRHPHWRHHNSPMPRSLLRLPWFQARRRQSPPEPQELMTSPRRGRSTRPRISRELDTCYDQCYKGGATEQHFTASALNKQGLDAQGKSVTSKQMARPVRPASAISSFETHNVIPRNGLRSRKSRIDRVGF